VQKLKKEMKKSKSVIFADTLGRNLEEYDDDVRPLSMKGSFLSTRNTHNLRLDMIQQQPLPRIEVSSRSNLYSRSKADVERSQRLRLERQSKAVQEMDAKLTRLNGMMTKTISDHRLFMASSAKIKK
jgi:hypothetical protein